MQGINKAKHRQLISLMLKVEYYFNQKKRTSTEQSTAKRYGELLESKFNDYQQSLRELEQLIESYDALSKEIQLEFLKTELRAVKKYIIQEEHAEMKNNS